MLEALLISGFGLAFALLGSIWWGEHRSPVWAAFRLQFPRDLTSDDAVAICGALSGLGFGSHVVFEVEASGNAIEHRLLAARPVATDVMARIHSLIPGLRYEPVELTEIHPVAAIGIRQKDFAALRTDAIGATSRALLSALNAAHGNESVILQWIVGGGFAPPPAALRDEHAERRPELRQARREKLKYPLVQAWGGIAVRAATKRRRRYLLRLVVSVLRSLRTMHGELHVLTLFQKLRASRLVARRRPLFTRPSLLNAPELASLIAWPVDADNVAGVAVSGAPVRRASEAVANRGRVFGRSSYPGTDRQIAQGPLGVVNHTLVAGPSGTGKTALLTNIALDDLDAGRSLVVIDGKGDLATQLLERIPDSRLTNLSILDLGFGHADTPVPGLKLFGHQNDAELGADLVLGVLADLFADSWGPLSEKWLRVGLSTVVSDPEATLADLPFLFTNDPYRRSLTGRITNPLLRSSWAQFEAMKPAERAHALSAPLNKLDTLLGRSRLRAVLGQRNPTVNVADVMNGGGVLVVNLAAGSIGKLASRLMGALVLYEVYRTTAERSRMPKSARKPTSVIIDEPRALAGLPVPLDLMFEQARGHGVGLTLAAQSVAQLPDDIARSVLSNAATLAAFRQNADDALPLARFLSDVSAADLQGLAGFELMVRMGLGNGAVSLPLTVQTNPVEAPIRKANTLTSRFAAEHGRTPQAVDAELMQRHVPSAPEGAVGRVRRSA